jgi:long-subunit acyl-CoA synthetase (AMP-forming)
MHSLLPSLPLLLSLYPSTLYESTTIKQGVELTHAGVLDTIISMNAFVHSVGVNFDQNEVFLSFLPLAHIFDRWVVVLYSFYNTFYVCRTKKE